MDKRKSSRISKKLEVRYQSEVENTAITSDLSEAGIFIKTNKGMDTGNLINLRLNLPNSQELFLRGHVVRNTKSLPISNGNSNNGMGIQLIDPPKDYVVYVQSIRIS
ncbi:MAG: PilZ domain-containing protein [Nitrospirae bacterium]|nr:PilZ domain-containing protein [Nitrospirota bacterium]